jgi:hypothetical protein
MLLTATKILQGTRNRASADGHAYHRAQTGQGRRQERARCQKAVRGQPRHSRREDLRPGRSSNRAPPRRSSSCRIRPHQSSPRPTPQATAPVPRQVVEPAERHLRASGVVHAQEQNRRQPRLHLRLCLGGGTLNRATSTARADRGMRTWRVSREVPDQRRLCLPAPTRKDHRSLRPGILKVVSPTRRANGAASPSTVRADLPRGRASARETVHVAGPQDAQPYGSHHRQCGRESPGNGTRRAGQLAQIASTNWPTDSSGR